jgi:hypothetical protein
MLFDACTFEQVEYRISDIHAPDEYYIALLGDKVFDADNCSRL